jgi:hypothetical protein
MIKGKRKRTILLPKIPRDEVTNVPGDAVTER